MRTTFTGSMTALVTPLRDGEFDERAYRGLIEFQIAAGTDGLVPCGTTGESATLSHEEHDRVVEVCIAAAAGRVPVIAGAGSNSTREALRLTRHAKEAGADAALLITPYYNKPTQEGLYRHFAHVAERVDIPIVLYNVPGRTGVNLLPETVARLAEIPNIVAIKEATADLRQASRIIELCGEAITVISGDDFTVLPLLADRRQGRHLGGLERRAGAHGAARATPSSPATSPRRARRTTGSSRSRRRCSSRPTPSP